MRASTAYFVGAGTIIAAIAIGLGGGIVAGNIMNPVASKQGPDTSKVTQRTGGPATTNAQSERVNYLTGSRAFGAMITAPARAEAKPEAATPDTQASQANAEPPVPQPSQAAAVEQPRQQSKPAPFPQAGESAEQQAATEPSSSSNNAYAKARDSDVKRAATERRRAERRERWAERHRHSREPRGLRDRTDWDDVARNVREDSDARDYASRPRGGFPQIRLFGPDDD
ncbi:MULTISPECIES: hypothetical protein [Bradyrhizobium]|uniref:hypothetical protein n=1 Tax=Bradyrhizobium TaxID=374 RepID=UPI0004B67732|nr:MULTISPECIES: hypothetical protein [unclassified Bradyrhizobium]MDA9424937.1 hypothetical protein [Bradyrhizobium sp. CCBAU 53380]